MHRLGARWQGRGPAIAMGGLALTAFVGVMYMGRGIDFLFDEWMFIVSRRPWTVGAFLEPHNEHIAILPVLVYKLLFETVGLLPHWPYRVPLAALYAGCGVLVYLLARPRIGGWGAVAAGALVLALGRAPTNIVWAFQIGFVGSVFFGLAALVALDRGRRALTAIALVLSITCSSLGVPFAIGIAVELALARRRTWWWVPTLPLALYGAWWLAYDRGRGHTTVDTVVQTASWAIDVAANAAGGAVGLSVDYGRFLLLALAATLAVAFLRRERLSPRLGGLVAIALTFWGLTGIARAGLPGGFGNRLADRYITLGAIALILVVVELLRRQRPTGRGLVLAAVLVIVTGLASLPALRTYSVMARATSTVVGAELGVLALDRPRVPAPYDPDSAFALPTFTAGAYFAAVDELGGSPAYTPAEIAAAPSAARGQADRVLQEIAATHRPVPRPTGRACRSIPPGHTILTPLATGIVLSGRHGLAAVRLRRWADGFPTAPIDIDLAGPAQQITVAPDTAPTPIQAQVTAHGGTARLCPAP